MLRLLQNHLCAKALRNRANFLRLMPNDYQKLHGLQWLASADHVLEERASTSAMKHLRNIRTHSRTLTCRKNHNSCIGIGRHRNVIVACTTAFGNEEAGFVKRRRYTA
jgi:hypothetical protein